VRGGGRILLTVGLIFVVTDIGRLQIRIGT
jgi:hypothetical protein